MKLQAVYNEECYFAHLEGRKRPWFVMSVFHALTQEVGQRVNEWICKKRGHKIVDCSSAGPDSGDMDHYCERCGQYWSVPLY